MPNLTDGAWACLALMQAMFGNVSSNVRMITLAYEDSQWDVTFYIESESKRDRDNAEDTIAEFDVNIANAAQWMSAGADSKMVHSVVVRRNRIDFEPSEHKRIIFWRDEMEE